MLVTLLGMVMEVKPVQPEKAWTPMLVTELPRTYVLTWLPKMDFIEVSSSLSADTMALLSSVTEVRPVQFRKAQSPMLVTPLPMVMEVRLVQPLKA